MLSQLHIHHFAIIESLELDFHQGLSVFTGETGAGKSIIIDALGLALGERGEARFIQHGADRAEITASFAIDHLPTVQQWLAEHDLASPEQDCILRRLLHQDGRTRSYINGQPCPLRQLKALGDLLVDIHGQHEHQSLLKPDVQRAIIDHYSGDLSIIQRVKQLYQQWQHINDELTQLRSNSKNEAEQTLLQYQVEELDALDLKTNELDTLHTEQKQLNQAETVLQDTQQALEILDTQDNSVMQRLHQLGQLINNADDTRVKNAYTIIQEANIQLQEAVSELNAYQQNITVDPERLQEVEQRLSLLHATARKHHVKPENLHAHLSQLKKQLATFANYNENIKQLTANQDICEQDYRKAAAQLSKQRQATAKTLNKKITIEMQRLNMAGAQFKATLRPYSDGRMTTHGAEQVQFEVSSNPGQPFQALNKVASGGELSRISLAIQVITAQHLTTPTLIFDEVDVGVGGATAEIVGKLLQQLGKQAQVLCVTHLPQVAAQGNQHLKVDKAQKGQTTSTSIQYLNKQERVGEVARMLGGLKITKQTLAHAEEMVA